MSDNPHLADSPRLAAALDRLQFSRRYVEQFLDDLSDEEWFWSPPEFTTHIAWQVAHLAASQYSLCLLRIRGKQPEDEAIIPWEFFEKYRIGSTPQAGQEHNAPLEEIREIFDNVQAQSLKELFIRTDAELDVPVEKPHPAFDTNLECVAYSPQHELVHAGQIALLRRLMGKAFKR